MRESYILLFHTTLLLNVDIKYIKCWNHYFFIFIFLWNNLHIIWLKKTLLKKKKVRNLCRQYFILVKANICIASGIESWLNFFLCVREIKTLKSFLQCTFSGYIVSIYNGWSRIYSVSLAEVLREAFVMKQCS